MSPSPALAVLLAAGAAAAADPDPAFAAAARLGPGINLGNALDAPAEGDWGFRIRPRYLRAVRQAGFRHVRVPVRWSAHAARTRPFAVDPAFFDRVDDVLDVADLAGLGVVLNCHHYDALYADPAAHRDRLCGIWWQIAKRYKGRHPGVLFEPLNEPHGGLTADRWNGLLADVLGAMRDADPDRVAVVGPASYNSIPALKDLRLPDRDRRIVATVHYYEPFRFTHQGADWVADGDGQRPGEWVGTRWAGTPAEVTAVADHLGAAAAWGRANNRPVYLGEFGAYAKADLGDRARWTAAVRAEADRRGMPWAYWEFGSGFGAYDPDAGEWRLPLLRALRPAD